jgi:hypothetical protein
MQSALSATWFTPAYELLQQPVILVGLGGQDKGGFAGFDVTWGHCTPTSALSEVLFGVDAFGERNSVGLGLPTCLAQDESIC